MEQEQGDIGPEMAELLWLHWRLGREEGSSMRGVDDRRLVDYMTLSS